MSDPPPFCKLKTIRYLQKNNSIEGPLGRATPPHFYFVLGNYVPEICTYGMAIDVGKSGSRKIQDKNTTNF